MLISDIMDTMEALETPSVTASCLSQDVNTTKVIIHLAILSDSAAFHIIKDVNTAIFHVVNITTVIIHLVNSNPDIFNMVETPTDSQAATLWIMDTLEASTTINIFLEVTIITCIIKVTILIIQVNYVRGKRFVSGFPLW